MRQLLALASGLLTLVPTISHATTYALVIGINQPPKADPDLAPLQYADDDAAALYELLVEQGVDVKLLSVLDSNTQALYPLATEAAVAPSLAQLKHAVAELQTLVAKDSNSELIVFYSGHGSVRPPEPPRLALLDADLTQDLLYREVLGAIPAKYTHLLIDACHAAAIVRPRGDKALTSAPLDDEAVKALWKSNTLAQFPHVGAVIAASAADETHEWSELSHGVFTHEVLSGLRGAADINGDQRIEYSELYAFIASANEKVADVRAKPRVHATPPRLNQRAAILALKQSELSGWLRGAFGALGRVFIENARGVRLLDVNAEPTHAINVSLPPDEELFVRSLQGEARLRTRRGRIVRTAELVFSSPRSQSRGAIGQAFSRGLFQAAFGPAYYQGFVSGSGMAAVDVGAPVAAYESVQVQRASKTPSVLMLVASGASLTTSAVLAGFAVDAQSQRERLINNLDLEAEDLQDPSVQAALPNPTPFVVGSVVTGIAALGFAAAAYFLWPQEPSPLAGLAPLLTPHAVGATFSGSF